MNSSIERVEWPIVQSLSWLCSIAVLVRGNSKEATGRSPRDEYGRLPLWRFAFSTASVVLLNEQMQLSKQKFLTCTSGQSISRLFQGSSTARRAARSTINHRDFVTIVFR